MKLKPILTNLIKKVLVEKKSNNIRKKKINEFSDDPDYDSIGAAKSMAHTEYSSSDEMYEDAIEYSGGEEEWKKMSRAEQQEALDFVNKHWGDRFNSYG
tara:strand:+ start:900 stop:1196 length:297 start_codon:yes stop_codon:yes gene_type:complete